jgi:hypothetical protein
MLCCMYLALASHESSLKHEARDVLKTGGWLSARSPAVQDFPDFLRVKNWFKDSMLARGINAIWRTTPTYITYRWLTDSDYANDCQGDHSGPPSTRLCADHGVYYLYMSTGCGVGLGPSVFCTVDWPPGGPKLLPEPYKIDPRVGPDTSTVCNQLTPARMSLSLLHVLSGLQG